MRKIGIFDRFYAEKVAFFTDLMQKIGNLLCKLAIYCVNFGVNFILQKFCLCKKNDKYQVCAQSVCFEW